MNTDKVARVVEAALDIGLEGAPGPFVEEMLEGDNFPVVRPAKDVFPQARSDEIYLGIASSHFILSVRKVEKP